MRMRAFQSGLCQVVGAYCKMGGINDLPTIHCPTELCVCVCVFGNIFVGSLIVSC